MYVYKYIPPRLDVIDGGIGIIIIYSYKQHSYLRGLVNQIYLLPFEAFSHLQCTHVYLTFCSFGNSLVGL